jgi:hypothetical protein
LIIVLTTRNHSYTHTVLAKEARFDLRLMSYDDAFRRRRFRTATYIFTDLDRLHYWELELAAHLYRQLNADGLRTLNDPARVSQRFKLLRQLKSCGINEFDAWSLNDIGRPPRYPVFLRTSAAHRTVLTGLLENEQALDRAIAQAVAQGLPERELMVVEYCAEPLAPGLFRKLSVFRIGECMVGWTCVHDNQWVAKYGVNGIAGQELYDDEFRIVRDNPYGEALRKVFEIAHIDYGRADFGLVRGRPQTYEINTNPSIDEPGPHPFETRVKASLLSYERLLAGFAAIDSAKSPRLVEVQPHPMVEAKYRTRWQRWTRWLRTDRTWRP